MGAGAATICLTALLFSKTSFSFPAGTDTSGDDPRFTQWMPPGPGDVRSPCPGINTLANHGFINRNGKNLTIPHLIEGLAAGMNMGADFTTAIGGAGLLSSPLPNANAFDLDDLDQHNFPIEHDASLSRRDAFFGDDHSFYDPNWQMVLDHYQGMTETSIPVAADAKWARVSDSKANNPTFTYGPREFVLSYGETALYLQTMASDPAQPYNGIAELSYVRSLFEQEKLPYELGWRRPQQQITLLSLGNMVMQLYQASPQPGPEGVRVTADTLKDAFEGVNPVTGLLGNLTGAL